MIWVRRENVCSLFSPTYYPFPKMFRAKRRAFVNCLCPNGSFFLPKKTQKRITCESNCPTDAKQIESINRFVPIVAYSLSTLSLRLSRSKLTYSTRVYFFPPKFLVSRIETETKYYLHLGLYVCGCECIHVYAYCYYYYFEATKRVSDDWSIPVVTNYFVKALWS